MSQNFPGSDLLVTPPDRARVFFAGSAGERVYTLCHLAGPHTHLLFPVKGTRPYGPQSQGGGRDVAAAALSKGFGRRHRGSAEGAEDVFLAGMETALLRRNSREVAAAGQRFL